MYHVFIKLITLNKIRCMFVSVYPGKNFLSTIERVKLIQLNV